MSFVATTEEKLLSVLAGIEAELAALRAAQAAESWPKTTAQFAAYVGREVRTVQDWIESGKLKANTKVRPALITRGNAERFLEGGK